MTARPWMPFYVADYLADTQHLNNAEHGAYMLLMFYQWQHGSIPDDPVIMARIARVQMQNFADGLHSGLHMQNSEWEHIWRVLKPFFKKTKEGLIQARLTQEMAKAADISSKRREAASVKYRKQRGNAESLLHSALHSKSTPFASANDMQNSANAYTRARGLPHPHIPSSDPVYERPSPSEESKINGHDPTPSAPATALPDGRAVALAEGSEASEGSNQPKPIAEQRAADLIEARKVKPNTEANRKG